MNGRKNQVLFDLCALIWYLTSLLPELFEDVEVLLPYLYYHLPGVETELS